MNLREKIKKFPETSGVYLMRDESGKIIYVGKATSLKYRVQSYFNNNLAAKTARQMMDVRDIEYVETDSPVEAIFLESALIKKHNPYYNIKEKDDKSRMYVHITREDFPRIYTLRETDLINIKEKSPILYGPFLSGTSLQIALELIRTIIPYRSCNKLPNKKCLYGFIGKCDAPCVGNISSQIYKKNIRLIRDFFEGKKSRIFSSLKADLKKLSKAQDYEDAAKVRDRIYALEHLKHAFAIKKDYQTKFHRAEGYDISNISGLYATGSMVVFIDGMPEKSEYRKFKIKNIEGANAESNEASRMKHGRIGRAEYRERRGDTAMMKEVLDRRFNNEWELPDLILVDGGKGQVNAAVTILKKYKLDIPVVGLAKGPDRKKDELITSRVMPRGEIELFKRVRDEAHRFARGYYEKLHRKKMVS